MSSIYDIDVTTIDGRHETLGEYRGQLLLIVNVASRCVFTKQYEGLEALHRQYHDKGLTILGFPCDQFGNQEPGSEQEIKSFCSLKYDVTFPLFAKINVNGSDTHPLYRLLKKARSGLFGTRGIKWNFTKFLVGRDGKVIKRYAPTVPPEDLKADLEQLLK